MRTPDWQSDDGAIRLYHGDCLELLPTIPAGTVDAVVTDPPYGVGFQYDEHDDSPAGYEEWCCRWFDALPTKNVLMACGAVNVAMWGRNRPFRWQAAWLKPAAMGRSPFGFCNWEPMLLWGKCKQNSVDVFTALILPDDNLGWHPCPKPLRWGLESVKRMTDVGNTVLDPFMGSGTTMLACLQTGRRGIGIEKDAGYFENIVSRIERELAQPRLPFVEPVKQEQATMFA